MSLRRRVVFGFYRMIGAVYWWMVRTIVTRWGKRGLHLIRVGELAAGEWKIRSSYREEMLLKAIPLFVDLRGRSCLDLACNDGFWSFRFGQLGIKNLAGVDFAPENIVRANFLRTVYNFPSFQFTCRDILQFLHHDNAKTYDIMLLLSILYNLPEQTDWNEFFNTVCRINDECLVIDSRWFDDDEYWYEKASSQAFIETEHGPVKRWRPTRKKVFSYLYGSGYEQVIEMNPSAFLQDQKEAYGNGDPYTLENVSDYISNHRSIVIAYKRRSLVPDIENRLNVRYIAN